MNLRKSCAFLTIALGLWLIAIPVTLGYLSLAMELSDRISGILLILLGWLSLNEKRIFASWSIAFVGLWLQLAPLVFWAPDALMYLNDTLVGVIALIFSFLLNKKISVDGIDEPLGWSLNPSSWSHRVPTVGLALLAWFFSRYMAAFQLGYINTIVDPVFPEGTLRVITSTISKAFPVSDAGLGSVCYTLEFILGWQGGSRRWLRMPWLATAFGLLVIPVGVVSIILIISQPVIVGAWCFWCLATAVCMLVMIVLTAPELVAVYQLLSQAKKRGYPLWPLFWKGTDLKEFTQPKKQQEKGGWSLPASLAGCVILGVWLIISPSYLNAYGTIASASYIVGPLIVATSIIACSEVFRAGRFLHILFGLILIFTASFTEEAFALERVNALVVGGLVVLLSWPRGKVLGQYGQWQRWIF